jgi:hypothetical protein
MAEGKLVIGQQLIDTGPCTDNQQSNMGELANLLDALGNPAPTPPPGPIGPDGEPIPPPDGTGGDTYDNVYVNEDGDLVYIDENGDEVVVPISGTGTLADEKVFYDLVWGSPGPIPTYEDPPDFFEMTVGGIHSAIAVHVPRGQLPNPSPSPVIVVGVTTITVKNSPRLRWVSDDKVYARYNHVDAEWDTDSSHNWTAIARGRPKWDRTKRQVLYHDYAGNTDGNSADAIEWWDGEECTVVESIDEVMQVTRTNGELEWKITYTTKNVRILRNVETNLENDVEVIGTYGATEC